MENKGPKQKKGTEEKKDAPKNQINNNNNNNKVLPLVLPAEEDMKGPTDYSNWIIKDSILVGAYPKNAALVTAILKQGISTFVCLMMDDEIKRQGKHYFEIAKSLVTEKPKEFPGVTLKNLQLISLPIYDGQTADDEKLKALLTDITDRFLRNEKIYIHCRGGHGRTGVVVSCLLAQYYELDAYAALEMCQKLHDYRGDVNTKGLGIYQSPETHEQKGQVYRVIGKSE